MTQTRSARHSPLLLALCSFSLLCTVAAVLHIQQLQTLQRMYQEAAIVRGSTLASDTSQKIAHALSVGIPLHQLVGVEALLESLRHQHPDLVSIEIQDTQARPLWASTSTASRGAVHASSIILASDKSAAAIVNAYVRPQQAGLLLVKNLWVWLGLLGLLTTLSFWAARLSFSLRPWLREDAIEKISNDVRRGVFKSAWLTPHSVIHDARPQQLSAGMRAVHEAKDRLQRLVYSLRQTEPSALRRQQLDAILQQSTDGLTLSTTMGRRRVHAVEQQCFWLSLLMALASTSPWMWQVIVATDSAMPLRPAATLYLVSMLVMGWLGKYIKLPVMHVLITGFVILLFAPFVLPHNGIGATIQATVSGLLAGFSYQAFQTVIRAARGKFIFARPRLSRPIERAYLYVMVCLAPLLAALTEQALSNDFARIALQLPAICGLMSCLLWNANISPWRTRVRQAPISGYAKSSWVTGCFYAAIGLCIAAFNTDTNSLSVQRSCLLMAGWCAGSMALAWTQRWVHWCASLLLVILSVWLLFRPSDLVITTIGFTMATVVATASARLHVHRLLSTLGIGIGAGLCISQLYSTGLTLSLSGMLLGVSCLISLKLSRQGVHVAD